MGKQGEILIENVIFFVLLAVFVVSISLFIGRAGTSSAGVEQIHAKEIALILDNANSGMKINLDISRLYEKSRENNFEGQVVSIDNENNEVIVRVAGGKGYSFKFFTDNDIVWDLDEENERLLLEFG